MFFKRAIQKRSTSFVAGIVAISLALSACGLNFGEKSEKQKELALPEILCMQDLGPRIGAYLDARSSVEEWGTFMTCIQNTFRMFLDYTEGEHKDYYLPEEIQSFLLEHFIKDRPIEDALVEEIMRWKVAVIGGSMSRFTRAEFNVFINLLGTLRESTLEILPYMAVINFKIASERMAAGQSLPDAHQAALALKSASRRLGQAFTPQGKPYHLASFETFLNQILSFVFYNEHRAHAQTAEKWASFLTIFKSMAVGGSDATIEHNEWVGFWDALANWSGFVVELRPLKFAEVFNGTSVDPMYAIVELAFSHAETAIRSQPNQKLAFRKFNQLFDALERMELLPFHLGAENLKRTFPNLVVKLLGDPSVPASRRIVRAANVQNGSDGMTLAQLNRLKAEYFAWKNFQQRLEHGYRSGTNVASLVSRPLTITPRTRITDLQKWDRSGWLQRLPTLFANNDFKPRYQRSFIHNRANTTSYFDLSVKNLIYSGIALVAGGYSEDPIRAVKQVGITEAEFADAINQNSLLLQDMKVLHPNATGVGERMYLEGNLFTTSGSGLDRERGDELVNLLDPAEGVELATFMLSSVFVTKKILDSFWAQCPRGPNDFFGYARIERGCFVSKLKDTIVNNWSHAPELQSYIRRLEQVHWTVISDVLLRSVDDYNDRPIRGGEPQYIQSTQVATISGILHYIESIFLLFDTDGNHRLDHIEAEPAFQRFRGLLRELTLKECQNFDDERLRRIFYYILDEKKIPDNWRIFFDRLGETITTGDDFWSWELRMNQNRQFSLSRKDIMQTFILIVDKNKDTPARRCGNGR